MSPRQSSLLEYHMDTAQLLCGHNEVFWVLDLEDPVAFDMACSLNRGMTEALARQTVAESRDSVLSTGGIPAITAIMKLAAANTCIHHVWHVAQVLPPGRYIAIVSGRLMVTPVRPNFPANPNQKGTQHHGISQTQTTGLN